MSRREGSQSVVTLKQISYRISSTPTAQLPRLLPQITSSIWSCRSLLSSIAPTAKQAGDDGVAVHRFKTQLSTLLQDRTVEGRWCAVALVKATLEAGGLEVLSKAGPWVKHLLGILKTRDPPTTRVLATIALTRIFMLTWDHANLIREITTPNLPALISSSLNNVDNKRCSSNELQAVLEAFATLIPRHPTTFRTNEGQIRGLLNRIISSTAAPGAGPYYTREHIAAAEKLLVLLHHCAPKQGGAEKWDNTLKITVSAAHATADRIFRSVIEDWKSTSNVQPSIPAQQLLAGGIELEGEDTAGMAGWKGVHAGAERLKSLINVLAAHLKTATTSSCNVRIGLLADLVTRLLSVTVPTPGRQDFVKPNQQVPKDERETLYSILPGIHATVIRLIESILDRFGSSLLSTTSNLLPQVTWAFKAEKSDEVFRTAAYDILRKTLLLLGPPMSKDQILDLVPYASACCLDLLPDPPATPTQITTPAKPSPPITHPKTAVHNAASALLPALLSHTNPRHLPPKTRAQIDRTAILTKHKPALLASVLNPPPNTSVSLLPFLARLFPGDAEVESLLRPRMPVSLSGPRKDDTAIEESDEDDDESDVDAMDVADMAGGGHDADDAATTAEPDLLTALDEHLGATDPALQDSQVGEREEEEEEDLYSASPSKPRLSFAMQEPSMKRLALEETGVEGGAKRLRVGETLGMAATDVPKMVSAGGSGGIGAVPAAGGEESDDGSDFEMPPLTMEPDTESEDEDEEGEGEE